MKATTGLMKAAWVKATTGLVKPKDKKKGMVDGRRKVGCELESNNQLVVSSSFGRTDLRLVRRSSFVMMRWLRNEGSCFIK